MNKLYNNALFIHFINQRCADTFVVKPGKRLIFRMQKIHGF